MQPLSYIHGAQTTCRRIRGVRCFAILLLSALLASRAHAADEGVAIAIIYDTSGSMAENVGATGGKQAPKFRIANKALEAIVDRIANYATNSTSATPRKIEAGLFVFQEPTAIEAVHFGPFDPQPFRDWVRGFTKPAGGTPLGASLEVASRALANSKLPHKHIVVITDGINTVGRKPEKTMPEIAAAADQAGSHISVHFVAFDVDSKVFDPVKKLGATVCAASNEEQLNTQLTWIFEKKILLEDEDPGHPAADHRQ